MKKTLFRPVSFLLAAILLFGGAMGLLTGALEAGDSPENHLIVHYDFTGETQEEQLRNKAADTTTGALTLGSTAGLSYIRNGVAHIDSAAKNYLTAPLGAAVQNAPALTVVTRVKISGEHPLNLVELAAIGSGANKFEALRWSANVNNSIVANGFGGVGVSSGNFGNGKWLNLAVTLSYANGSATVTAFSSADGKIWTQTGTRVMAIANQIPNAKNLILGKLGTGMADRGRSFDFADFRIYDAALNASELGSINLTDLMAVYDFEDGTTGGLTSIKTTVADGVATIPADGMLSTAALNNAIKASDALTLFMEFKADYVLNSTPWHNLFQIVNVARVAPISKTGAMTTVSQVAGGISTDPLCDTDPNNEPFAGDWVRLAYVIDAGTKQVTLLWSADGGNTWKSRSTTFAGNLSAVNGVQIGHNINRGLTLAVNEVRLYSAALDIDAVKAIVPNRAETEVAADANLTLHYDFIGSTDEEKLTDKVSGQNRLTLASTGASEVRGGTVTIDAAAGNYLLGTLPAGTNLSGADGMTVLTSFRVDSVNEAAAWQPVFRLDGTVMLAVNPKGKTVATAAGGVLGAGVSNWVTDKTWSTGSWLTVAAVLKQTAAGVQETLYFTYDEGATWYCISAGFDGQTLTQSGKALIIGKNAPTVAGEASFTYRDLRVYDAPLTLEQLQAVTYDRSPDLTVAGVTAGEGLSVDFSVPEANLAAYAGVTANATFRGRTVELTGRTVNGMRVWSWTELSALTLCDPISLTLTALTGDGRTLHGETVTVTALDAIRALLNSESATGAQKRWCVDLLRYAAAAQKHFGYRTDALATDGLTAEQLALGGTRTVAADILAAEFERVADADFCAVIKSTTLSLTFATRLDLLVKVGAAVRAADLTLVIRDADGNRIDALSLADAAVNADGCLTVGTKAIGDGSYDRALFLTVYENFGMDGERAVSDTVRYSIETYIARCLAGVDDDLAAAMLNWSDAIRALRT